VLKHATSLSVGLVFAALVMSASLVSAQGQSLSSILGTVTDQSGLAVPGVSIELTSPALQAARQSTTDAVGRYNFPDLPTGKYAVKYELIGFQTVVREGLELSSGFAARVDITLKVGAVEQNIIVTGASPLVDVTRTAGGQTLSTQMVNETIPSSRMNSDLALMTPGLTATSPVNIGLLGILSLGGFTTYGDTTFAVLTDGVDVRTSSYPDYEMAAEVDVKTFGNGADVASAGANIDIVSKSGGNDFHGSILEQYMTDKFQSSNLDDTLRAQGLANTDSTIFLNDVGGELGGRIVRDKLWFYGAYRDRRNARTAAGFVNAATPLMEFDPASGAFHPTVWTKNETAKVTYQASKKFQLIGYFGEDYSINTGLLTATPRFYPYQAGTNHHFNPTNFRGEVRGVLSKNTVFNASAGEVLYDAAYFDTPGNDIITSRYDLATQIYTGGSIAQLVNGSEQALGETDRTRYRKFTQGNLTTLPQTFLGGGHQIKVGYRFWFEEATAGDEPNHPAGNYQLIYNTVNGVKYTPVEIETFNFPVVQQNIHHNYDIYAQDQWQLRQRLTLNLGVRYSYNNTYVPPQTKVQGQFGSSGSVPFIQANRFSDFAPRLGLAWDVTGDAKTVIKATASRYDMDVADSFAAQFNPNGVVQTYYRWNDPTHCDCYVPGTVNLDTNGPDFISLSGSANNIFNPNLKLNRIYEATASIDRELMAGMAIRVLYIFKDSADGIVTENVLRPYSAYNIPVTVHDPGPSGTATNGPLLTIYDYSPAFRGSAFIGQEELNRSTSDSWNTFEVSLNKRAGRWAALTSFSDTKDHRWLSPYTISPNDNLYPLDAVWNWVYKISGNYELPYGVQLGALFDIQNGLHLQRTNLFSGLPQSVTATIRMEPYGSESGPIRQEANIRLSKKVTLHKTTLNVSLDALNAFNSNSWWSISQQSGPTFDYATQIQSPRVLRFGAAFRF
jgi:outer membrane receptor protein involved in Fe transport